MATGNDHLAWAKGRALTYARKGDASGTMSSLLQDFSQHEDTAGSADIVQLLMLPLILGGHLSTPEELVKFVEDFQ